MFRGDGETFVSKHILKNNYKTIYNPKASVLHLVPKERMTIEYFKRRSFNQGISNSYSDIRKIYFNKEEKNANISVEKLNGIKKLYRKGICIKNKFQKIFTQKKVNSNKIRYKDIYLEISDAVKNGYEWHQDKVKEDKDLYSWVIKDNYFDD